MKALVIALGLSFFSNAADASYDRVRPKPSLEVTLGGARVRVSRSSLELYFPKTINAYELIPMNPCYRGNARRVMLDLLAADILESGGQSCELSVTIDQKIHLGPCSTELNPTVYSLDIPRCLP